MGDGAGVRAGGLLTMSDRPRYGDPDFESRRTAKPDDSLDVSRVRNGFVVWPPVRADFRDITTAHVFSSPEALASFVLKWANEHMGEKT